RLASGARRREARREADADALDALADLEVQHGRRADPMRDELVGARVLDYDVAPVDADLAAAVEDRPHRPCDVRAAPRPRDVGGRHDDPRVRVLLGAYRRDELALDAEQLLDRELGLVVGALAEVELVEAPGLVEEVARRPALVVVQRPQQAVAVDADGVLDLQ